MAQVVWTEPALHDLDRIADYMALDKPEAAKSFVQRVFDKVEHLQKFPKMGKLHPKIRGFPYRHLTIPPCQIFYKHIKGVIYILYIHRSEQLLQKSLLKNRDRVLSLKNTLQGPYSYKPLRKKR